MNTGKLLFTERVEAGEMKKRDTAGPKSKTPRQRAWWAGVNSRGPRCVATIVLGDGSGCACARTATVGALCAQHAKMAKRCDGCHVRSPWEHRCHGLEAQTIVVNGERVAGPCECPECKAVALELAQESEARR